MTAVLFNSIVIGAAAIVAGFAASAFASRAATRFALWFCLLIAVALLSPLTLLLPPVAGTSPSQSGLLLAFVWIAVSFALLTRTAVAYALWRRRLEATLVADENLTTIGEEVRRELHCSRRVRIRFSSHVRSPQFLGLWLPTIALPEMDDVSLRAVLIHEIAHVRRYDDLLLALEAILKSAFFFNPCVYLIAGRMKFERELSCDEAATEVMPASSYAELLLRVAERTRSALTLAVATLLTRRIVALLDRRPQRASHNILAATIALLSFVGLMWCATPILIRRSTEKREVAVQAPLDVAEANAEGAEHFVNARSLLDEDQYNGAISEFSKSIDYGYEVTASAYNISVAYERLGDIKQSRRWRLRANHTIGST